MPAKEQLSDDYVASLLAKDAKSSIAKYSTYGLQELLPRRATNNAPKPNTRFLKNIIRETDSHNAALRAKEGADSRARLREIPRGNGLSGSLESSHGRLSREDDRPHKRRRVESEDETRSDRRRHDGKPGSGRDRDKDSRSHRSNRRDPDSDGDREDRARHRNHRHGHHRSHRRRSEERSVERIERVSRHQRQRHSRHRSKSRSRSSSGKHRVRRHRRRSSSPGSQDTGEHHFDDFEIESKKTSTRPYRNGSTNGAAKRTPSPASESDPLESIIGPPPPPAPPKVQARGRGTFASASAMDSHFSSHYDPAVDVRPDPDLDDDWDMALEALRDRQKWKTQGAERLKAAGFTEEEVQKWEKGGEKKEEDVRWRGRGEGREWDRGKVIGEDGIETVPEWGRLKGT